MLELMLDRHVIYVLMGMSAFCRSCVKGGRWKNTQEAGGSSGKYGEE